MNGISGHVSTMMSSLDYLNLKRIDMLKHDLHCLKVAGMTGPVFGPSKEKRERQEYISNVEKLIKQEERRLKLQKINK